MDAADTSIQAWRLNPVIQLHWRDWGGDSVVFEARSGLLQQFDPFSAATMACIESGVTDLETLSQQLAEDLGSEPDSTLVESLCTLLERLLKLGWIERLQPQG